MPAGSFPTDPATGLHVESFSADHTFAAATRVPAARLGTTPGNNGVIVEHFRPIEPKAIRPITIDSAHGALLTELTSSDVNGFDPVYARPTVDSSGAEPEVQFDDLAFPSKLQAVTTFRRLRTLKQQVVLAQGQFFATNSTDGAGTGTQRLFTHEAGTVFSSPSTDYAPPVFTTLDAQVAGGSALFAVDVTDRDGAAAGTVKRVVVAYLETRRQRLALHRPRSSCAGLDPLERQRPADRHAPPVLRAGGRRERQRRRQHEQGPLLQRGSAAASADRRRLGRAHRHACRPPAGSPAASTSR